MAHLMLYIFGYTNQLSNALQKKDQDIINAMTLVSLTKEKLQSLRNDGWENFLDRVISFCKNHEIEVPDMNDYYVPPGRPRRLFQKVKNIHRFRVEMFLSVIDLQIQELNNRLDEVNMELLICMACLNPANSFAAFDQKKILRLAEFYPHDFTKVDLLELEFQLEMYIYDVRNDARFQQVKDLGGLSCMLVETSKDKTFPYVYLLLKLVLILPVATTSVERVFSGLSVGMEDENWLYKVAVSTFVFMVIYFMNSWVLGNNRNKIVVPPSPPRSIPVIGHLHLLKKPLHRTLQSLSAQHGPVFGLKLGKQYTVVVSSAAAVEECFGRNDVILADRPQFRVGKHLHYGWTTMGASNYGDHWRNVRRISNQEVFAVSRQHMFQSLRQEEVKSMIKSLFRSTRSQGVQKVEMKSRVNELAFNVIVGIVTGKYGEGVEDWADAKEFQVMIREIFELSAASNPGFLRMIDYGDYEKKMVRLKKRIDEVLQGLIDENKTKNGGVGNSMISNILALQQRDSTSISDKTIKGLIMTLITAGTDTNAVTIEWALSLLLNNPEKLKKAQSELDAVISPGRLVDEADLHKLTYLQAIINETLRMYPAAPLLVPHYSSGECTIQGFHVPSGTMVLANAWALHRDPEVWDDPLSFKPERFENVEESYSYKLVPFGTGRRSCPGASMANKVVGLGLASLIQCFDWERVGEEEVDMREGNGLTMPKLIPLEAMCQPRSSAMDVLSGL
uniref:Cytochrome P450 n=1 Tax=Kalanchoe fedtschenkoi TaxID=63787 RepID=A0A7N0T6Q6_KALFE